MMPQAGVARFKKNCPQCGAPVEFKFAQAVQTVCPFCKSILVRRDVNLETVGSVADPLLDSSPIQIGTEGVYANKPFVVVGRIVYEYEGGRWNEWHCVFNDSTSGWLSDAQLEYALTVLIAQGGALPNPPQPGARVVLHDVEYMLTTLTKARYVGVEGELPFEYWDKRQCLFVDLQTPDARFATIDYSENPPLVFAGYRLDYDDLKLKNVKLFEGWK